ncbi:MAG TPA: alpha/beta hydrolase [Gemmatimonadaceae bacterium]|nr:alpha/beta hydrolase [Gemmatimonadaceae bacterium]
MRALARLPGRAQVALSGERRVVVDGQTLDPQFQLVRALRRRRGLIGLTKPDLDFARARRQFTREATVFAGPATRVRATRDLEIPGPGGSLRARHYLPPADGPQPLLVYLHGGGFVFGDLDTHDEPCRVLCAFARMHVLSVDYRLAPEHPFPAALDDTLAALRWAREHAAALGADPARVTIGGDSAGANLATVAARLAARDGAAPLAQLLIYPPTDAITPRPSQELFGEGYILTNADREMFTRYYIAHGSGTPGDDRISPLRARDLRGQPPALVVTAGFDLLRDEGEAYSHALAAAGNVARLRRVDSLGHGFVNLGGVCPAARRATIAIAREWRALVDDVSRQAGAWA